jgi:hypothetical protein
MGQEGEHAAAQDRSQQPAAENARTQLAQYVLTEAQNDARKMYAKDDPNAPAPTSAGQRMWEVTKDGIGKVPEGFMNSLDPNHILPNVGMGFLIGAGTKLILPAGGPVAKVAAVAMGTYFIGKPLYDTYKGAYTATTMGEMDAASDILGNMIGGLPVTMVEGGVGAYAGSRLMGAALSTRAAAPFVEWKQGMYDRLDMRVDNGLAVLKNTAYNQFGVGSPVLRAGTRTGIVPPYMLEELAAKNPGNPAYAETIQKTNFLAKEGARRQGVARIDHQGAREIYDAKGTETIGTRARSEGQPATGLRDVDAIYEYSGDVRNFYRDVHGRNSIDGKGMKLESTVHYGQNYENAFWDGSRMTYGKPGPQSPFRTFALRDVHGHEVAHGVTEYTARTVYRNQPGALNEHYSDVWGALLEQRVKGQKANEASWLVGEGIWKDNVKGRALRDMQNPGKAYNDPLVGKDPQPAHMRDYNPTRGDNGGVHINSGIPNKAFAEFAKDMGGYAYEAPAKIWFEARTNAGAQPSFAQFAHHTIEAARKLGYTDAIPKLERAWGDVGIKPNLLDSGKLPSQLPGGVVPITSELNRERLTTR